jgi:LemA protein
MVRLFGTLALTWTLASCGLQAIPTAKNQTDATFAEVTNQYKRRADLVPNLVASVKGYAKHESETLEAVTAARARATSVNIDPKGATTQQLKEFQEAQGQLSSTLSRLLVVAEKYPELKADRNFSELQAQLEGTENRIAVARNRHIEAINEFNNSVTVPPSSWVNSMFYHFEKMPQWSVDENEQKVIEKAPNVDF